MQSQIDQLLGCIVKELADVAQLVGQCISSGLSVSKSNQRRIRVEMHEAIAAYEVLIESMGGDSSIDRFTIEAKKRDILKSVKG